MPATAIITPQTASRAVPTDDRLIYWKQILPESEIQYTDPATGQTRRIQFDDAYFDDLVREFNTQAVDQLCVQVADKQNGHGPVDEDMSPEAQRAEVVEVKRVRPTDLSNQFDKPGLWGRVRFFNKKAAKMVRDNPKLGVSARIREGYTRGDGRHVPRAMVHVLATIDPYNNGMSPWRLDMANADEVTLDLSNAAYRKETKVSKGTGKNKGGGRQADTDTIEVPDDLSELSDDELQALGERMGLDIGSILAEAGDPNDNPEDEDDSGDEDEGGSTEHDDDAPGTESTRHPALAGAGSTDLSVVASVAQAAYDRADEAVRAGASAQWESERTRWQDAGVPPATLDLAAPYLSRPGGFTIDLSNDGGSVTRADVAGDIRKLLQQFTGYVDLAVATGHGGQFETAVTENDPDKPILDAWAEQHGS